MYSISSLDDIWHLEELVSKLHDARRHSVKDVGDYHMAYLVIYQLISLEWTNDSFSLVNFVLLISTSFFGN
jgi:hypothetical protein